MSVDKAFREMIRAEITEQLKPLHGIVARMQANAADLEAMKEMTATLAPLAKVMGPLFGVAPVKRGPGRPKKNTLVLTPASNVRRGVPSGDKACAVIGCTAESRTKGYCSAHYQKLRLLIRTGRRPTAWVDGAKPQSVDNVTLPRGRAAAKALKSAK